MPVISHISGAARRSMAGQDRQRGKAHRSTRRRDEKPQREVSAKGKEKSHDFSLALHLSSL
jgi:hypothetical protein